MGNASHAHLYLRLHRAARHEAVVRDFNSSEISCILSFPFLFLLFFGAVAMRLLLTVARAAAHWRSLRISIFWDEPHEPENEMIDSNASGCACVHYV